MERLKIKNKIANGELTAEQAERLFKELHGDREAEVTYMTPRRDGGFDAVAQVRRATDRVGQAGRYIFNHQLEYDHYLDRKDVAEGFRHSFGTIIYGATGIIKAGMEGTVYLASEVLESASFGATRMARRLKDGAERGWRG